MACPECRSHLLRMKLEGQVMAPNYWWKWTSLNINQNFVSIFNPFFVSVREHLPSTSYWVAGQCHDLRQYLNNICFFHLPKSLLCVQDEKALTFLVTVPQKWRLFWAVQSAGVSFSLALVAIYYIGETSPLLEGNNGILKSLPTWFVWVVNPVAVTLCAVVLSSTMHSVCDLLSEARENVDEPKFGVMVASSFQVIVAAVKRATTGFGREPWFYVAVVMWLGQAVAMWSTSRQRDSEWSVAALFHPSSPGRDHARLTMTDNISGLLYSNIVLVIGLALQAVRVVYRRHRRATVVPLPRHSLEPGELLEVGGRNSSFGLPCLLVGSGLGYWVSSLLYVLRCSWHGGGCGWNNAPVVVTLISYVVLPGFFMASMFMVAEVNFFGRRFGTFIKPAVDILKDRRSIAFWTMLTVFRDLIDVWIGYCHALMTPLIT